MNQPSTAPEPDVRTGAIEALTALFALGREVTSVLDLEELLAKIPELISRITHFQAFAVYLLDPKRNELTVAYSVGERSRLSATSVEDRIAARGERSSWAAFATKMRCRSI